ncbi:putative effector protein, partial [Meloidogyne graminicola]
MGFDSLCRLFSPISKSSTPIYRTKSSSRLSKEDIDKILESNLETNYTYSDTYSYKSTIGSHKYIHPKLFRKFQSSPTVNKCGQSTKIKNFTILTIIIILAIIPSLIYLFTREFDQNELKEHINFNKPDKIYPIAIRKPNLVINPICINEIFQVCTIRENISVEQTSQLITKINLLVSSENILNTTKLTIYNETIHDIGNFFVFFL